MQRRLAQPVGTTAGVTKISQQQQADWLRRSFDWPGLEDASGWWPVRVLGAGSHGIVGLWKHITRETASIRNAITGQDVAIPAHVVVKQGRPGDEHMQVYLNHLCVKKLWKESE